MPINSNYHGYIIRQASKSGGKAGKGHNKTSSFLVAPQDFTPGDYKTTTIRFKVGDIESYKSALNKARAWVDARVAEKEAGEKHKPILDAARAVFAEMHSRDFCGCYEGDLTDEYAGGVDAFVKSLKAKLVKMEVRNSNAKASVSGDLIVLGGHLGLSDKEARNA